MKSAPNARRLPNCQATNPSEIVDVLEMLLRKRVDHVKSTSAVYPVKLKPSSCQACLMVGDCEEWGHALRHAHVNVRCTWTGRFKSIMYFRGAFNIVRGSLLAVLGTVLSE